MNPSRPLAGAPRYEHSVHDAGHHCWLDLRDTTPERYSMIAWCHGAPGIALARVDLAGYLDDSATLDRDLGDAITEMPESGLTGEVISGVGTTASAVGRGSPALLPNLGHFYPDSVILESCTCYGMY